MLLLQCRAGKAVKITHTITQTLCKVAFAQIVLATILPVVGVMFTLCKLHSNLCDVVDNSSLSCVCSSVIPLLVFSTRTMVRLIELS